MSANVEKYPYSAILTARYDYGILAHEPGHVVSRFRHFRLVCYKEPTAGIDLGNLQLIHFGAVEDE